MRWLIVWIPFMTIVSEEWPNCPTWFALVSAIVFGASIHYFFEWYWPAFCERHPPVGRRNP